MPYTAEEKASRRKAYWIENREQLLAKKKIYQQTHRAEILAKKKMFYQQNKARLKAEANEWHKNHPEYAKEHWDKKGKAKYQEERKHETFACAHCGATVKLMGKSRHLKGKKCREKQEVAKGD